MCSSSRVEANECCRYLNPGVSLSPAKLPIMCCPSLGRLLALHFATRVADLKGLVRIMHRNYQVENWSVRVEREQRKKKKKRSIEWDLGREEEKKTNTVVSSGGWGKSRRVGAAGAYAGRCWPWSK